MVYVVRPLGNKSVFSSFIYALSGCTTNEFKIIEGGSISMLIMINQGCGGLGLMLSLQYIDFGEEFRYKVTKFQ